MTTKSGARRSAEHLVFLGLGANLGDRRLNLALAIGQLRQVMRVEAISPAYETEPLGVVDQPRFINLVVRARTELSPQELHAQVKAIEAKLGRKPLPVRHGPRPIDIDILLIDGLVIDDPASGLKVPHPEMAHRAFVLVPLADLAPDLMHPQLGRTIAQLRDAVGQAGVRRLGDGLLAGFTRDIQAETPMHNLALERVGVLGLERVIHLACGRRVTVFYAQLDLWVDLLPEQKGAHMSRFPSEVDVALDALVRESAPDIETLAARIAAGIVASQGAQRSRVAVRAKVPRSRRAPLSAAPSQEVFDLLAWAASNGQRTAALVGVEALGMTACPCGQEMLRDHARERLSELGFDRREIERILAAVPIATHNQRARGTLVVTDHPAVSADDLLRIIDASMSSETYELLKRPDEFFVINRAHGNAKFAEDVVRDMLALVLQAYMDLPDSAFLLSRLVSEESIHRHNVFAERSGLVGDLRRELSGSGPARSLSLDAWLDSSLDG